MPSAEGARECHAAEVSASEVGLEVSVHLQSPSEFRKVKKTEQSIGESFLHWL